MSSKMQGTRDEEQQLMTEIWDSALADDPLSFVKFAYPWGKRGTPLESYTGPRAWQREVLEEIRNHIRANKARMCGGSLPEVFRLAMTSGRGIGKSALIAQLTHWLLSVAIGSTVIVTANTEQQLKDRTWAELRKWITFAINGHWFDATALSLRPAPWFEEAVRRDLKIDTGYYYAQAQLWSEEKPDSFAGTHNPQGVLVIFDEASGIPPPIWVVAEGYFTEPVLHRYWLAASNPRRNTGAFFECFHKNRSRWNCRQIDSRTIEGVDTNLLNGIIAAYGEDSDQARVEVKGLFPRQGDRQFIGHDIVEQAATREVVPDQGAPLMMGVDVARFGNDTSEIHFRQGLDSRSFPRKTYKGIDLMQLAGHVCDLADRVDPDLICPDGCGVGGGLVDILRSRGYRVFDVQLGARANNPAAYANVRTELWARMRDWLARGAIPDDRELKDDLLGPEYHFSGDSSILQLETKESMKRRGLASPNKGDALALTFAAKVARRDSRAHKGRSRRVQLAWNLDYDPCA